MLRTIHSNAVCVNCLAVFVWLIVLMSWGWQNRCSLPRYLFPSLCLPPFFSFSDLCIPFILHYPCNSLTPSAFFFPCCILLSLFFSHPLSVSLTYFIHCLFSRLCPECFFIALSLPALQLYLSFSQQSPTSPHYLLPSLFFFFSISYLLWIRIPHSVLWIIQACNMLSTVISIKAVSIKRIL